jgi:hypothetical protein
VGRHEGILKFITDRGNVTRTEVETYYRNGIRVLISETVDEEFNKVSFFIENLMGSSYRSYNGVLTRNPQTGQYILSYGGAYTNDETRTITANSLEALSSEMRNGTYKADFDQTGINNLRAQAALIPAVKLNEQAINDIKGDLTDFYTNPNAGTYNAVKDVYTLYANARITTNNTLLFENIRTSCGLTLAKLNGELLQKVLDDAKKSSNITTLSADQQRRLVGLR